MTRPTCFKAYDIRGRVGDEITETLAHALGGAIVAVMGARQVVLGRDARDSSPRLLKALAKGIMEAGADVHDLGLCGTEEVYFATAHIAADAGVMVTASHNPMGDNGFKIVGPGAAPLSPEDFEEIAHETARPEPPEGGARGKAKGKLAACDCRATYVAKLLSFVAPEKLRGLKILMNAGNGAAGPTCDAVLAGLQDQGAQLTIIRKHHAPDPRFPNGIPNPLLPENQPATAQAVVANAADFGVAWDGDFDRCFFFDHTGAFVPGEYMVGLLAAAMLQNHPGARIVHDNRVFWNTQELVQAHGGSAVPSATGHALMKAKMRGTDAIYGGEMSAHHYFRDFMFCDSGMIPWMLVAAHIAATGQSLRTLVADMRAGFPSSGEQNFRVADADAAMAKVQARYGPLAVAQDDLDGLSLDMGDWRMSLRRSNTEPLLRLNIEARGAAGKRPEDVAAYVAEIAALIAAG